MYDYYFISICWNSVFVFVTNTWFSFLDQSHDLTNNFSSELVNKKISAEAFCVVQSRIKIQFPFICSNLELGKQSLTFGIKMCLYSLTHAWENTIKQLVLNYLCYICGAHLAISVFVGTLLADLTTYREPGPVSAHSSQAGQPSIYSTTEHCIGAVHQYSQIL